MSWCLSQKTCVDLCLVTAASSVHRATVWVAKSNFGDMKKQTGLFLSSSLILSAPCPSDSAVSTTADEKLCGVLRLYNCAMTKTSSFTPPDCEEISDNEVQLNGEFLLRICKIYRCIVEDSSAAAQPKWHYVQESESTWSIVSVYFDLFQCRVCCSHYNCLLWGKWKWNTADHLPDKKLIWSQSHRCSVFSSLQSVLVPREQSQDFHCGHNFWGS